MANNLLSKIISEFALNYQNFDSNKSSREIMNICLADWVSVAIAGQNEEISKIVLKMALENGGRKDSFTFGSKNYLPSSLAALVNGTISHSLDFDDTNFEYLGHPSVVVIPSTLAIADKLNISFEIFVEAAIIGMEISTRVGKWLGRNHYRSGFHITSTAGVFGATVSSARLLNLSLEKTINAIGIASSRASGIKAQFGTMGKPYHAGMAASAGVESALLAKNGFQSSEKAIDGFQGFGDTHMSEFNNNAFNSLGNNFIFEKLNHKFHACCHGTHASIEALILLRDKYFLLPCHIKKIDVFVHPQYLNICNITNPKTPLEAKFSYKMLLSMVMNKINTSLIESFSNKLFINLNITSLMDLITIKPLEKISELSSKIDVTLKSEKILTENYNLSNLTNPIEREKKMITKTSYLLGEEKSISLWNNIKKSNQLPSKWVYKNFNYENL